VLVIVFVVIKRPIGVDPAWESKIRKFGLNEGRDNGSRSASIEQPDHIPTDGRAVGCHVVELIVPTTTTVSVRGITLSKRQTNHEPLKNFAVAFTVYGRR